MRYFVMALSIACLDLGKEENEENENDNISENVNSRFVSMTGTWNTYTTYNYDEEEWLTPEDFPNLDCTSHYINDEDALDIDCEICDFYGFMIYIETTGQCNPDVEINENPVGYGFNIETGKSFYNSGTAWLEYIECEEITESSATCASSYSVYGVNEDGTEDPNTIWYESGSFITVEW